MLSASLAEPQAYTLLLGFFALLAVALAAVGLYGLVSYTVAQRTHEVGIRMALGAEYGDVLRQVLSEGFGLALTGTVVGLAGTLIMARLLTQLIADVQTTDPLILALVSALLMALALVAAYLPARRAAHVDPIVALRYE